MKAENYMKTIVIANHKGGCAKTTTALNLAIVLASQGSRVLAVDLDPQGNLSVACGADLQELESTRCTSHRMMLDARGDIAAYRMRARPLLDLIGSGANSIYRQTTTAPRITLSGKYRFPHMRRSPSYPVPQLCDVELPLPDLVH